MRVFLICVLLGLLGLSCAIPEPPPGGPEDKTAPAPVGSQPQDGSSGVPADARVSVVFSEKLGPGRIERFVEIFPSASIERVQWKDRTLVIEFDGPLHSDTTYVVRIKPGYVDAHNVRNDRPYEFAFATSAEIDTGSIAGRIYFRRKPTDKGVVRLFVVPRDSAFSPQSARADREATTGEGGTYAFAHLPARGVRFVIWAFQDDDGNSVYSPDREVGASISDTLVLSLARPRLENMDVFIVDPKEPAKITGRVINETPYDSIPVTVTLSERTDTVPPSFYIRADAQGRYAFDKVLAGAYVLNAFIDLKNDSVCGSFPCPEDSTRSCAEFCATYPDSLFVAPGDEKTLKDLRLETKRE